MKFSHLVVTDLTKCTGDQASVALKLIERYSEPSIADQTADEFEWLVWMTKYQDNATQQAIDLHCRSKKARVIFYTRKPENDQERSRHVRSFVWCQNEGIEPEVLITTRLPPGGGFHKKMLESVQECALDEDRRTPAKRRYTEGLYAKRDGTLYQLYWRENPFESVCDRWDLNYSHTCWSNVKCPTEFAVSKNAWLMTAGKFSGSTLGERVEGQWEEILKDAITYGGKSNGVVSEAALAGRTG